MPTTGRSSPLAGLVDHLMAVVASGTYGPGDRLPGEDRLAGLLSIGRPTVRGLLAALNVLGVVTPRPSSGVYLNHGAADLLTAALDWPGMLSEVHADRVREVGLALDVETARRAAGTPRSPGVQALQKLFRTVPVSGVAPGVDPAVGVGFHTALARTVDNSVFSDLIVLLGRLSPPRCAQVPSSGAFGAQTLSTHREILRAVAAGDPDAAGRVMREHLLRDAPSGRVVYPAG